MLPFADMFCLVSKVTKYKASIVLAKHLPHLSHLDKRFTFPQISREIA